MTRGCTRDPAATLTFCALPFRTNTRQCWGLGGLAALLRNPQPFIEQAVATAVKEGYTGYNFDNELRGGASFPWFAFLVHTLAPTPTRCSCPTAAPRALHQSGAGEPPSLAIHSSDSASAPSFTVPSLPAARAAATTTGPCLQRCVPPAPRHLGNQPTTARNE